MLDVSVLARTNEVGSKCLPSMLIKCVGDSANTRHLHTRTRTSAMVVDYRHAVIPALSTHVPLVASDVVVQTSLFPWASTALV